MTSLHPRDGSDQRPGIFGLLAVCALLFGAAVLWLDVHSGAPDHRLLLLVVGLVSLGLALVAGIGATVEARHRTPPGR